MYIKFAKVHIDARAPERANPSDAGLDVFYCPVDDSNDVNGEVVIMPSDNAIFPTGLKLEIPHGYYVQAMNRGSMAAKKKLIVGACVIDANYRGEVFIDLHNVGFVPVIVKPGDKIAQLVLHPVIHAVPLECAEYELYEDELAMGMRGVGKLGSTGE